MISTRFLNLRITWLLLCAVLFGALAPSIAQARATSPAGNNWVALCSVSGSKRLVFALPGKHAPLDHVAAGVHCPFCLVQHHTPVLPADSADRLLPRLGGSAVQSATALTRIFSRPQWPVWHSRAPPALA
jgi:hypothetical protein